MSWLTQMIGVRRRRMPFENEATPETVRAEWMREWMEEDQGPRTADAHPQVLFKWVGHWTRWSQMSHTYEPLEGRFIPATLVEHGNTLDPPPRDGDRFRFVDGEWTRLAPDDPDEPPPESRAAAETDPQGAAIPKPVPSSALPPARPIRNTPGNDPDADPSADPAAEQIATWRRRIRRGSNR